MDSPGQQLFRAHEELEAIVQMTFVHDTCTIQRQQELLTLTIPQQMLFLMGGTEFTPAGGLLIQQLGIWLRITSFREIRVMGPVDWDSIVIDSQGQFDQRMAIAKALATALVQRLQETGVDARQLSAKWYGQILPVVTVVLEVSHQHNSRLEIILER